MNKKVYIFVVMALLASISCNVERVLDPSLPTNTPEVPINTPLPTPTHTPTPIPTPLPGARIESGDRAYFNGDWDKAIQEYTLELENNFDPEIQVAALLGLGRSLHQAGDLDLANTSLMTAIDTYPQSPSAAALYFALGEVYESQGNFIDAAIAYQEYANLRSGIIDYYIQEQIGDMWFKAKDYEKAITAYQTALQAPYIADKLYLNIKIGDSYEGLGDIATSLVIYEDVHNRTMDNREKALMKFYIGWAKTTLGQVDEGAASYLESISQYPQYYSAYESLLDLLENGVTVDWYNMGRAYHTGGQYGLAIDAFVRHIKEIPDLHSASAHYYLGEAYYEIGNYEEAINQWQMLIDTHYKEEFWAESFEKIADTHYILRDYDTTIQTYLDFFIAAPEYPQGPDYLYYAGRIAERTGDLSRAADLWARMGIDFSTSARAFDGLFQAGIARYRLEEYDNAVTQFSSALGVAKDIGEQAAAQFWIGKCYDKLGEFQASQSAWIQASTLDPTGYYSIRAGEILQDHLPFSQVSNFSISIDFEAEKTEAVNWMHTTFNIPPEVDLNDYSAFLSDPRFLRGTELWNLGLKDEAKDEFTSLRLDYKNDPANLFRLANYLLDIGHYFTSVQCVRNILDLAGYDAAGSLTAPAFFSHIRYGTFYSEIVLPITTEYDLDPLLFYSIMRRESLFESFITSAAGAGGLMQIYPPTGEALFNKLQWPVGYTYQDLYRPIVSVRYGAFHLDEARKRFGENWHANVADYHAGYTNTSQWLDIAQEDPDLFVEVIRIADTRNYVRWVYELHSIYKNLYGTE